METYQDLLQVLRDVLQVFDHPIDVPALAVGAVTAALPSEAWAGLLHESTGAGMSVTAGNLVGVYQNDI